MAKQKYSLNAGEMIVLKVPGIQHGFWGTYSDTLVVTNQSVILEKYGTFNNFKGIERFNYTDINQAIKGESSNGDNQLELYVCGKVENFALQSSNENDIKILVMAINDQIGPNAKYYDYQYYQDIISNEKDTDRILELRAKVQDDAPIASSSDFNMIGSVAKNFIKSGNFSSKGLTKAIAKSSGKQKKTGVFGGIMNNFLDDLGVRDIQDEFTEMGNEFREGFGLKAKITHAEKKELEQLETKQMRSEIQGQKNAAMQDRIIQKRATIDAQQGITNGLPKQVRQDTKISVKEQMELLQQVKILLDAGVLTQEEFEQKKQEILNS